MAFEDKWGLISTIKQDEILNYARETSARQSANKFADEIQMSALYLARKINKVMGNTPAPSKFRVKKVKRYSEKNRLKDKREAYAAVELTPKENKLLKDIAAGKVSMEDASRIIAAKAFEKILKDPTAISFNNFLQSELLKIRKDEVESKNSMALELMNRMFAGQLPTVCPHCGKNMFDLKVIQGKEEILDVESLPAPRNN